MPYLPPSARIMASERRATLSDELQVKIEARITELEAERDKFVAQANSQLTAYGVPIEELCRLIAPPQPADEEE